MKIIKNKIYQEKNRIHQLNKNLLLTIILTTTALSLILYFLEGELIYYSVIVILIGFSGMSDINEKILSHEKNLERFNKYFKSHTKTLHQIKYNKVNFFLYLHSFHTHDTFIRKERYTGPPIRNIIDFPNGRSKSISTTPDEINSLKSPIEYIIDYANSDNCHVVCLANLTDPLKDNPNIKFIIGDNNWHSLFKELSMKANKIFYYISSENNQLSSSIKYELDYIEKNIQIRNKTIIIKENDDIDYLIKNYNSIRAITYDNNIVFN